MARPRRSPSPGSPPAASGGGTGPAGANSPNTRTSSRPTPASRGPRPTAPRAPARFSGTRRASLPRRGQRLAQRGHHAGEADHVPNRPLRPCAHPGCPAVSPTGRCPAHTRPTADDERPSAARRLYGRRWRDAARGFLRAHPLCATCQRHGQTTAAIQVDHVVPHKGDLRRFWDRANWQPLCRTCGARKSATEPGGRAHRPVSGPTATVLAVTPGGVTRATDGRVSAIAGADRPETAPPCLARTRQVFPAKKA